MSRRRNRDLAEAGPCSDLHRTLMESPGPVGQVDGDFLELEADEELLCSVSDITEHLSRNITVVLETALSKIRKMVSIRIRVLMVELREKTEEIEELKARLERVQRDGRDPYPSLEPPEPALRKHDLSSGSKPSTDPRRPKVVDPGVKKENIDAICDYLMKDKNSRGSAEMDGEQVCEPEPHPLNLWTDGSGPGDGTADDLFSMIPSGSKRVYDYEWMNYPSELKGKQMQTQNKQTGTSKQIQTNR